MRSTMTAANSIPALTSRVWRSSKLGLLNWNISHDNEMYGIIGAFLRLSEPIRYSPALPGNIADLVQSIKAQGLEGLIAKRWDSRYEPGERTGAWRKMRVNQEQDFVIGGHTVGGSTFDALIFGYYEGEKLMYAGRTRSGFTPRLRADLMKRFRALETLASPFANLPEPKSGRWGAGLTAAKMNDCRWLKPTLVGRFEYVEWTPENHLRHSRFMGLR